MGDNDAQLTTASPPTRALSEIYRRVLTSQIIIIICINHFNRSYEMFKLVNFEPGESLLIGKEIESDFTVINNKRNYSKQKRTK